MREPELLARFKTDPQGHPEIIERDQKSHYQVIFEIKNPPPDVYAAQFELDPTYYDPVRTVQPDDNGNVVLKTTSYGDYPVTVTLHTKDGEYEVRDTLSRALNRARDAMPGNSKIDEAISEIKSR
ncbi:MAG TPA: pYEATS domain-containing protein [Candidatus Binatia bacterium]|nr:pYEATS domain-containing protein [Candidatus Binatia bacterium]